MKKWFLFFNLSIILFVGLPNLASAKKKYRYIKREHGVRFQGSIPMSLTEGIFDLSTDFKGAYTYNWKGMLEFGPYFNFNSSFSPNFILNKYGGGLLLEYNIIKNRGKRKVIPAVGVNLGVQGIDDVLNLSGGVQGALKLFVNKRTPFTVGVTYMLLTPITAPFTGGLSHQIDVSMGFSYYFDFY